MPSQELLWQCEEECASFIDFGLDPGFTSVLLGDFSDYRKPYTGAIDSLSRRKGLEQFEDPLEMLLLDTRAVIAYAEFPKIFFFDAGNLD
jgi:hypothetical protein